MRRYPFVIAGTLAGTAAVLSVPLHKTPLEIPSSASAAGASGTTSTSTAGTGTSGSVSATSPTTSATNAPTSVTPTSTTRSATGTDEQFRYGDIAVTVTIKNAKVTKVGIASLNETDGRSAQIDSYAVPQLEQQAIDAGSANISGVSGATFTSQAFVDSLSSALTKLGLS